MKISIQNIALYFYGLFYRSQLIYGIRELYNYIFKNPIRILCTHRIIDLSTPLFYYYRLQHLTVEEFKKRIAILARDFNFISLEEAIGYIRKKKTPPNCLVLTFDEGYKDNFTNVFPILKRYQIPATIFLSTDYIGTGKVLWHDCLTFAIAQTKEKKVTIPNLGTFDLASEEKRMKSLLAIKDKIKFLPNQEKEDLLQWIYEVLRFEPSCLEKLDLMMSWDDISQMQRSGLISFQSHSASHAILTKVPLEEAKRDILRSKAAIEEKIGKTANIFSYPNGWYNGELKSILKNLGFIAACTVNCKINDRTTKYFRGVGSAVNAPLFALQRDSLVPEAFNRWIAWMYGLFELGRLFRLKS